MHRTQHFLQVVVERGLEVAERVDLEEIAFFHSFISYTTVFLRSREGDCEVN
jgi:5,10-methenyltetrahydromethanopterin hydrogenase